jgi:hypothetical protein
MLIEQYEVIKESIFLFENLEEKIKGRIVKIIKGANAAYQWDLNYYCRLDQEAGIYYPSAPFGDSIAETERKLMSYVKRFEKAVQVVPNDFY